MGDSLSHLDDLLIETHVFKCIFLYLCYAFLFFFIQAEVLLLLLFLKEKKPSNNLMTQG